MRLADCTDVPLARIHGLRDKSPVFNHPGIFIRQDKSLTANRSQDSEQIRAEGTSVHIAQRFSSKFPHKKSPGGSVAVGAREGAVTYFSTFAVSSAWQGLTSLFGMGRGGALALLPP